MKPVKTEHSNHSFGPPDGVETTFVRSVWELSDEERAALVAGANVELEIGWLGVFPPVALSVTEERTVDG